MSFLNISMLRNRFNSVVIKMNEKAGTHLDPSCKGQVELLINQGIERMSISKLLDRADKQIQAEENLEKLVKHMDKHARSAGTFPSIDVQAFDRAKMEASPLWPFC